MTYDELVDEAAKLGGWTIYDAIRRYDGSVIYCPISAVISNIMGQYYSLHEVDKATIILGLPIEVMKRIVRESDTCDEALFKRLTT